MVVNPCHGSHSNSPSTSPHRRFSPRVPPIDLRSDSEDENQPAMTQDPQRDSSFPQAQPPTVPKARPSSNLAYAGSNLSDDGRTTTVTRQIEASKNTVDTTSDRATAAFIRRTLCAHNVLLGNGEKGRTTPRQIEELLPPLTSSNEIDLHLYAIIAVIIKEFVYTWYSKITPDHVFVNEVIQIIAHCTRALEQRFRKVDLEALLLDEIPELFREHLNAFRLAKQTQESNSLAPDIRVIYHTLHPHPALSPVPSESDPGSIREQKENEVAWRQLLVQGVLAVLLPTEDLENACLRALVAEIFAEMILGKGISDTACQSWLLWESITRIAEVLRDGTDRDDNSSKEMKSEQALNRLERFGLLSSPIGEEDEPVQPLATNRRRHEDLTITLTSMFWLVIQYAFLACNAMRAVIGLATSSSLPLRSVTGVGNMSPIEDKHQSSSQDSEFAASRRFMAWKRPIVSMTVWSCTSRLLELDLRMPWLAGFLSLVHWGALLGPGRVGDTDGVLDRMLSHTIQTKLLNPTLIPTLLRTVRATLFPNNSLGPPRVSPTAEEALLIKRRCAATLLDLAHGRVADVFFATRSREEKLADIESILDCLRDPYLNRHFVFSVVELVIVRLVPELAERGVKELMEERLG